MSGSAVVVTDHAFGGVRHERAVAERFGRELRVHACADPLETRQAVAGADVVLVNFAPITRDVMAALAPGAVVIRYGVGYDNVDVEAARELGVRVCNVPDYGVQTVADHTVACLLALLRHIGPYTDAIRSGGWLSPGDVGPLRDFSATTVGLVGTGRIGQAVAGRLAPFGFHVIAYDPFVDPATLREHAMEPVDLPDLFARAHAVSLHAPLTRQTRHLVDATAISSMRAGTVLVNTSRGALVDETALADALTRGHLGGAALDVFDPEPLAEDSPLRRTSNVILTPHAAFYSERSLDNLQRLAAEEVARALEGQPLRCRVA